jgi:hypothetical protein
VNEGAAVKVPHYSLDDGATRAANEELFHLVESGQVLSYERSAEYRKIYQGLLWRNQQYLNRFDRNLTVMSDVEMEVPNNVHGNGIEGSHDHHDASARSNFVDMRGSISRIKSATGPSSSVVRVKNAVTAYKDLMDILLHLATAPQTKSVLYRPPASPAGDEVEAIFEDVLREFKEAQFQPVNSPDYKSHIVNALNSYDRLVLVVQGEVYSNLNAVERTISGMWGGWQSLGPPAGDYEAVRISRKPV